MNQFETEQSEPWFFSGFMYYAKIILYIQVHFLFPKLSSKYVMIFQFLKYVSDHFLWQAAE